MYLLRITFTLVPVLLLHTEMFNIQLTVLENIEQILTIHKQTIQNIPVWSVPLQSCLLINTRDFNYLFPFSGSRVEWIPDVC